jgi:hypothetical protein
MLRAATLRSNTGIEDLKGGENKTIAKYALYSLLTFIPLHISFYQNKARRRNGSYSIVLVYWIRFESPSFIKAKFKYRTKEF